MQTLYAKNEYMERENARIKADMKAALSICKPLSIYCAVEFDVWGIWIEIDHVKYLVDPIDLVDSIYKDDEYSLLECYPSAECKYRHVDIRKDDYCFSWRLRNGLSKDPHPMYFHFQEYISKIKTCLQTLYAAWLADKAIAYKDCDFDMESVGIAVEQMNVTSVMPSYYRLMTDSVNVEPFIFEIEYDTWHEHYTIGIGNGDRQYTTWLTHWDNDYDCIRYELESFVYHGEAEINLSFDQSDTVVKIKHATILDKVTEQCGGYGFSYKDYALVEIQPNTFVHGPIIKGYCDLKNTIKTFYEGLLTLALQHDTESPDKDVPSQIDAYNMFKSPIIEKYLAESKKYYHKSHMGELRQVQVKRIITLCPDKDELIVDSEGNSVDIEDLYDSEVNPISIPELYEWWKEKREYTGSGENPFNTEDYHERGIDIAKKLRRKLSSDFDLWYQGQNKRMLIFV